MAETTTVGVTLESGEELRAPVVMSGAHPQTTVLDLVGERHFPDEVVEDMRRYKTRGGSVKVNWVLSEPPRYEGVSEEDFVEMRTQRDATLSMPKLILPSIQVNMRGGRMPEPEENGVSYLKLPLNQL